VRALPASENVFICSPGLVSLVCISARDVSGELAVTLCDAPFLFEFLCQPDRFLAEAGNIDRRRRTVALHRGRGAISSVVDGQQVA
jgi:hypothetical protein